jgi:GNAT superfamily N-acetyltransferase
MIAPNEERVFSISHTTNDAAAMSVSIRPCRPDDAEALVALVRELAVYERLEAYARATPDDFRTHLFGPRPMAEAVLAEVEGLPVGFALYFMTFSTFRGRPGIYLEDLFVRPEYRGRKIGKSLLAHVARVAVERRCARLEWSVLDWNAPAIGFYVSLGAKPLDGWTVYRITDEPQHRLAAQAEPPSADSPTTGTDAG